MWAYSRPHVKCSFFWSGLSVGTALSYTTYGIFMKRLPVVIALFDCGRTDRHDKANLFFWQVLCERDKFGRRRILPHPFLVHYLLHPII
jgi:hypothetical protein